MERRWLLFAVALVVGTTLDLVTKHWAFATLPAQGGASAVTSFFSLRLAVNEGAAFGMLRGHLELFLAVAVVALVGVPYLVHTAPRRAVALPIVLGLVLAGALGNGWDRVVHGHVRDFLDVHTPAGARWPTFNVADVFVTGGSTLIVLLHWRDAPPAGATAPADVAAPQVS